MKNALVSVIIPIYNASEYLDSCLESITAQTYENVEIILVDDGSTDGSGEKCDAWKEKDKSIAVYHIKNNGPSAARNFGLDVAKGDFIYFCDSDDKPSINLLAKSMSIMNSNDVDMLAFGYNVISSRDEYSNMVMNNVQYDMSTDEKKLCTIVGPFCKHEMGWNLWNRVFKKDIIDKYHIRLDPQFTVGEDKLFCLMYLSHCEKVVSISDCLYDYIQRTNSIMNKERTKKKIDFSRCNNIVISLYNHYTINDDCAFLMQNIQMIYYPFVEYILKSYEPICPSPRRLRKIIIDDLNQKSDIDFFYSMLSGFNANSPFICKNYSLIQCLEKRIYIKWLINDRRCGIKIMRAVRNIRNKIRKG